MVRVPHHYLPAGPCSVHGYTSTMLGQCSGYEAIERLQIVDAVASHRRFSERLQQPLRQVSLQLLALLHRGRLACQHRLKRRAACARG
eukprot:7773499-Pyramimonas_sp.AAC.1